MPPRKKLNVTRAGPSSVPDFDRTRFKSQVHEQRFNNIIRRNLVRERGFEFEAEEWPEFQNQIAMRKWGILCGNPGFASQTIVKEFYANAFLGPDEEKSFKSFVRGREVDFSARTINHLLGDFDIRHLEDQYFTRLSRDQQPTAILRDLCRAGAAWVVDGKGQPKHLKKSDFKPIPSIWCTFVQSKLLPLTNHSEVILKRALLVHCIIQAEKINAGRLISDNIHRTAQDPQSSLGHPSLITRLCEQAGVLLAGDLPLTPEPPINSEFINRTFAEFRNKFGDGEQAPVQPPPPPQASGSSSRPQRTNRQRLERMENLLSQHIRQNERKFDYLIASVQGLEGMNRRLAEQLNLDPDSLGGLPVADDEVMAHINFDEEDDAAAEEEDNDDEED